MCRLYGFFSNEQTKVECTLVHAQNALIVQSQSDSSGKAHANGWGVAIFEADGPCIEKQAWAAFHGEHFRQTAARAYSRQVLAHVRRATVGEPKLANTHPFEDGGWAFVHNGTIPNFDLLKPMVLDRIPTDRHHLIAGQTDSEHMFHLVRAIQLANPERGALECLRDSAQWVVQRSREVDAKASIGLNIMMSDGHELIGTRLGRPLHYVERRGIRDCEICGFPHVHHDSRENYRAIVLASEPISHESWSEVPDASLYRIDDKCRITWTALELLEPSNCGEKGAKGDHKADDKR